MASSPKSRDERLAEALRANLRRRKAQERQAAAAQERGDRDEDATR